MESNAFKSIKVEPRTDGTTLNVVGVSEQGREVPVGVVGGSDSVRFLGPTVMEASGHIIMVRPTEGRWSVASRWYQPELMVWHIQ